MFSYIAVVADPCETVPCVIVEQRMDDPAAYQEDALMIVVSRDFLYMNPIAIATQRRASAFVPVDLIARDAHQHQKR